MKPIWLAVFALGLPACANCGEQRQQHGQQQQAVPSATQSSHTSSVSSAEAGPFKPSSVIAKPYHPIGNATSKTVEDPP